jgi:hypothetical protein
MVGILDTGAGAVEDFRGDLEELAAMMRASWGEADTVPYLYTAELIADHLRYPGVNAGLAPAIYDRGSLVAFALGLPRTATVAGVPRRLVISAFLTVATAYKSSGYGILVWAELMRRSRSAGFDGVVNYCEHGAPMQRMISEGCRVLRQPLTELRAFAYLTCAVPPAGPLHRAAPERPVQADQLTDTAARLVDDADPCRLWTADEAEWQLSRAGGVAVSASTETGTAILTGVVQLVADAVRTPCLVIQDVLWGELETERRPALVAALLQAAAARHGARFAIVPRLGYADLRPFAATGFAPAPHTMHAYLSLWSATPEPGPGAGLYLDVV